MSTILSTPHTFQQPLIQTRPKDRMKHWSRAGEPSSNLVTTQLEGDMKNLRSVTGPLTFPQNVIARS